MGGLCKLGSEEGACCFKVKNALFVKSDIACGVDKIKVQELCKNNGVKILATACGIVSARTVSKGVLDICKLGVEGKVNAKLVNNGLKSLLDSFKSLVEAFALYGEIVAVIKHIGDFGIAAESFTGCGGNNKSSCGVGKNDVRNLAELTCIGKRASAELDYLSVFHNNSSPFYEYM